ncbi:hypothetical protein J6590_084600 [Homalodisca vitripennis]|nr:hypothetical protein J6590_084600 [Homalodisca vitripennis]
MSKGDYKKLLMTVILNGLVVELIVLGQPTSLITYFQFSISFTLLTDKITELTNKVDSLTSLPAKVDNLISEVENVNKNPLVLERRVNSNETKIKTLEEKYATLSSPGPLCDPEEIVAEMNDRARRSMNGMLFNLAESQDKKFESRKLHDRSNVEKLVTSYLPDQSKKRPIKLIFECDRDAKVFLASFFCDFAIQIDQCFSTIRVSRDSTPLEMEYIGLLRSELGRRASDHRILVVGVVVAEYLLPYTGPYNATGCCLNIVALNMYLVSALYRCLTKIGCVYIPPNQVAPIYANFCMAVDEVVGSREVTDNLIVVGDFNLPCVDWHDDSRYTMASIEVFWIWFFHPFLPRK